MGGRDGKERREGRRREEGVRARGKEKGGRERERKEMGGVQQSSCTLTGSTTNP